MRNRILMSDSYKFSHHKQYPEGTEYMHSYIESRGGRFNYTRFFGLQYFLKEYLSEPITQLEVEQANNILTSHGEPFDYEGWTRLVEKHGGKLPIRIRAVQEGAIIPTRNVLVTVESTDPEFFWLTGWIETALLRSVWYGATVSTTSYNIKLLIKRFLEETSDDVEGQLPFKLHDFGARGASTHEAAGIGGLAHLTNFMGTDTVEALEFAVQYYGAGTTPSSIAGYSIPAAEHSTITSWGRENEEQAFRNMVEVFGGDGKIYAVVSDSYNFFEAVDKLWGQDLKDLVIEKGGKLVIRPDSGDAVTNILYALESLSKTFGYTVNSKGFKVLKHVGLIQGDGVHENSIYDILKVMKENGYSADNIAFGMGGALLQGNNDSPINRDTQKFAMKCSSIVVNGEFREVYKSPITDKGKVSKKGRLDLVKENGKYVTVQIGDDKPLGTYHLFSELQVVFENGELLNTTTLAEIRQR